MEAAVSTQTCLIRLQHTRFGQEERDRNRPRFGMDDWGRSSVQLAKHKSSERRLKGAICSRTPRAVASEGETGLERATSNRCIFRRRA